MTGCHNCGALSGLDPHGTCNACGKPCDYQVACQQLAAETRRANSAEAELRETVGELEQERAQRQLDVAAWATANARLSEATALLEKAETDHRALVGQALYYKNRLTEAIALLERWARLDRWLITPHDQLSEPIRHDTDSFLSRAPAQPAYRCGSCRDTGRWSNGIDCPVCGQAPAQPAAPEPSAERETFEQAVQNSGLTPESQVALLAPSVTEWRLRAESAESTLAAAQQEWAVQWAEAERWRDTLAAVEPVLEALRCCDWSGDAYGPDRAQLEEVGRAFVEFEHRSATPPGPA